MTPGARVKFSKVQEAVGEYTHPTKIAFCVMCHAPTEVGRPRGESEVIQGSQTNMTTQRYQRVKEVFFSLCASGRRISRIRRRPKLCAGDAELKSGS